MMDSGDIMKTCRERLLPEDMIIINETTRGRMLMLAIKYLSGFISVHK